MVQGGASAGFVIYHAFGPESSFRLREPSGVFTSEMSAIFVALIQIRARRPGKYLIKIDSMSSLMFSRLGRLRQGLTRWYMKSRRPVGG
jgi:hypothetical protein